MRPLPLLALLLSLGCAPSLLEREGVTLPEPSDTSETGDTAPPAPRIVTTASDGVSESWIDSTAYLEFVYMNLATGEEVAVSDPLTSTDWDLGFERYLVASDGGVSGTGGVEVAALAGQDFEALTTAPAEGYAVDLADDDDENTNPEYAMGDWFDYAEEDHTVTPTPDLVYVIHATDGTYYKWQFVAYYDDAGTPAYITARWAPIGAPTEP